MEILKGELTQQQITAKYGVHSTQLHNWKKQALEGMVQSFSDKKERQEKDQNELVDELYKKIGQQKVELDWLKKNQTYLGDWRNLIDSDGEFSIRRQCELLGRNRSSLYYKPIKVDAQMLLLMNLIDEEYTRHPFYGTRRMMHYLRNLGHWVNRKRVRRLYRLMGLEAIYPKPNLSKANIAHKKYPYLLRDIEINRCNQVWSTDITYIRLKHGFVYLIAIIDWHTIPVDSLSNIKKMLRASWISRHYFSMLVSPDENALVSPSSIFINK